MEGSGNYISGDTIEFEPGKMFIGGLSWETNKESLVKYFTKFGELDEEQCVIMKDSETGRPRGFGFVKFKDPQSVEITLRSGPHVLDRKTIDPKQATAKGATVTDSGINGNTGIRKKVFVGGLPQVEEDVVKEVFRQFGNVAEIDIKLDKQTNRTRGFGFIAFDTEEAAINATTTHFVYVEGKKVEVKPAQPRGKNPESQRMPPSHYTPSMASYQGMNYQGSFYGQQPPYASGQYGNFQQPYPHPQSSQQYAASGYAAATAQRYPYEYNTAAQQHSYPQDTNSYGVANPNSYPAEHAYNSANAGYGYTTDHSYHHYDQTASVAASAAAYPRAPQTQQRGTAVGAYNNFGAAR